MGSLFELFTNLKKSKLPSLKLSEEDRCFKLSEFNKPVTEKPKAASHEQVWIVRTSLDLLLLREKLAGFDVLTVGITTSSLEPSKGYIVGVGLSIEGLVAYIPIAHVLPEDRALLPDQLSLFEVVSTLNLKSKKFIVHNAKLQFAWFKFHAGIELKFAWDTFLAAKLLQPNLPADLQKVAIRELEVTPWLLNYKSMKTFQAVDLGTASNYCAKDVLYTYQISQTQQKAMAAL